MAKVTYITPSGEEVVVEDAIGNLMEIAREHDVEGIEGACSGCCSCATCHIQVPTEWLDKTGRATESEMDLIDLESGTDERSRLSCQVEMTDALDGLVVQVAPPSDSLIVPWCGFSKSPLWLTKPKGCSSIGQFFPHRHHFLPWLPIP